MDVNEAAKLNGVAKRAEDIKAPISNIRASCGVRLLNLSPTPMGQLASLTYDNIESLLEHGEVSSIADGPQF